MTIAAAARKCLESFDAIDQILAATSPSCLAVEDGRSRYKIWASNLGSMHPETDRRSADYRLREAPEVISRILELLDELIEINAEIFEILSGERENRQLLSEYDDSCQDELTELHLSVGDIITSLFKVSMLVKKATKRDRYAKAASANGDPFMEEFDIRHVADKHPKVRAQPWLLERLGKAISQRRQFLRYCRNHKSRIAHVESTDPPGERLAPKSAHNDGKNILHVPSRIVASTTDTSLTRPTLTPTDASTLYPDKIGQDDLQDLDDDDAVSQTTSIITSQIDAEDTNIQIPRLEDMSQRGQPFECSFCFGIIQTKRQRSWRKHVLADLRAYVCMSKDCDAALFEDKNAWQAHDVACHRRRWQCHYCRRTESFSTAIGLENHLRSTHNVNEIPEEVLTKVISSSSHPLTEIPPHCPLCDYDDQVRQDALSKGQQLPEDVQVVVPLADYHRHIARHQEQLALFAVPPAIERSVESESRNDRSQADPNEQRQFMARWHDHLDAEDEVEDIGNTTRDFIGMTTSDTLSSDEASALNAFDEVHLSQDATSGEISIQVPTESELAATMPGYSRNGSLGPRHYRKHIIIPSRAVEDLKLKAQRLVQGEEMLDGYDDGFVKPIFEQFIQAIDTRGVSEDIRMEDLVRVFYATATSHCSEDNTSSDGLWKADVERSAALLMDVLIGIMENHSDVTEEIIVQLREEQAQMISRVNHAVSAASGLYFKQTLEEPSTKDDPDGGMLDIDAPIMEALTLRLQDVASGRESLPGFDDEFVKRTFTAFSASLATLPLSEQSSLERITSELKICALSEISKDETLNHYGTTAMVLRHEALLLSLLISVEHQIQSERHGSAPRIRSRFTSALVDKRAKVLSSMAEPQGGIVQYFVTPDAGSARDRHREQNPGRMALTTCNPASIPIGPDETVDTTTRAGSPPEMTDTERPPRVMRCHQCQHSWTSKLASELTECPQCGSYSVLTESPKRTASPEHHEDLSTAKAPGEEALGQYFSERTEKYMNLYRKEQPQSRSATGSQDSFPDPWSHLHGSGKKSRSQLSGTLSETGLVADSPSKTCYTCRHRFTPQSTADVTTCPRCGSDTIFTDFPWNARPLDNPAAGIVEPNEDKPKQAVPDITSPKPSHLIGDLEEMVANLQRLQDRYSSNTADIPEVIVRILRLSASLKRLANVENVVGFQRVQGTAHILCLSIKHTLDAASAKLHAPLNETQWMMLKFHMSTVEQVGISERLKLYQTCIVGLLKHLADYRTGLTADSIDVGSIKSLLDRQANAHNRHLAARYDVRAEEPNASPTGEESTEPTQPPHQDPSDPQPTSPIDDIGENPQAGKVNTPSQASESLDTIQLHRQNRAPQQLVTLFNDTEAAAIRLQKLHDQHPYETTDLLEVVDQLISLRDSIRRLSQLSAYETRDHAAFAKVQEPIQVVCRSMQHTLSDILPMLSKTPDESKWTEWILLNIRMGETEKVGLSERLRWYAASVMGLTNHLDGFPSAGRIFQWLGMEERVKTLLERQESGRSGQLEA